jgi:hypothetical protein
MARLVEDVYYCPACDTVYAGPCGVLVPDICPLTLMLAQLLYARGQAPFDPPEDKTWEPL